MRSEETPGPTYPIGSVDNALRLLRLVGERQQLRLSDAGQYLGVAHSTAHRLLAMLAHHDFVRQDPVSKLYLPGPALLEVGLAAVQKMDVRARVRPILEQLSAQFGETVHLAVRETTRVRYLDAIESTMALRVVVRTGTVLPANCTSVGKVLLAELTTAELHQLYPDGQPLPAETEHSVVSRDALEAELEAVRQRGYGVNVEESEEGVASVAVAIHNSEGRAVASISIATPKSRMTPKRRRQIADALLAAARDFR
jgi:IclR family acetate operon transcriptional repressor